MVPRKGKKQSQTSSRRMLKTRKGKKQSQTSSRPVLKTNWLKTERPHKTKALTTEDAALQEKISKRGIAKKSPAPVGNLALKVGEEKSFKKKNKSLKKSKPQVKVTPVQAEPPGIICLTNLPHGFYEKQLMKYFSQFGDVTRVRLVRSKYTGKSCGYGYVEFRESIVARIAAETMNNYLTFGKIIKCRYIEYSKLKAKKIFGVVPFRETNCPKVVSRTEAIMKLNAPRTQEQRQKREQRVVNNFNKKLKTLQALGVNLDLKLINEEKTIEESEEKNDVGASTDDTSVPSDKKEGKVIFEADQSDEEITIKTPPFTKKKLVKITPTSPAVRVTDKAKRKPKSAKKTTKKKQPLAKTLFANGKDTPKSTDKNNVSFPGKTQKVKRDQTKQEHAAVDKKTSNKRRKSIHGAQEKDKVQKRKRSSL